MFACGGLTGSLITTPRIIVDMKKPINGATSVKTLERDLKIASSILDGRWAIYRVISESGFLAGKGLWSNRFVHRQATMSAKIGSSASIIQEKKISGHVMKRIVVDVMKFVEPELPNKFPQACTFPPPISECPRYVLETSGSSGPHLCHVDLQRSWKRSAGFRGVSYRDRRIWITRDERQGPEK
jgi:hypothetical protein